MSCSARSRGRQDARIPPIRLFGNFEPRKDVLDRLRSFAIDRRRPLRRPNLDLDREGLRTRDDAFRESLIDVGKVGRGNVRFAGRMIDGRGEVEAP